MTEILRRIGFLGSRLLKIVVKKCVFDEILIEKVTFQGGGWGEVGGQGEGTISVYQ